MEDLSGILERRRIPLSIAVDEVLRDHTFRGQAVLPAVYSMEYLARAAASFIAPLTITDAQFKRFLALPRDAGTVEAFCDLTRHDDGSVTACLMSTARVGAAGITRTLEHVRLRFAADSPAIMDAPLCLEGIPVMVPSARLYGEAVPFGPSFHTLTGDVAVSAEGALGRTKGGHPIEGTALLGSPFPLDAAFHAACLWGQRHRGFTGFPVGLERRVVVEPLAADASYGVLVVPERAAKDSHFYTIIIFDDAGRIREHAGGVELRDITAGALPPPAWLADHAADPLFDLRTRCRDLCILPLACIPPAAAAALTPTEAERHRRMQQKRGTNYLGARLALKILSRRRPGADRSVALSLLETDTEERTPRCPVTGQATAARCTVSHDRAWVVAALGDDPFGIDVEEQSDRVLKARRFYMSEDELALAAASPLGEIGASLRVWSIKEAVAKALGEHLMRVFDLARVTAIGAQESSVRVDGRDLRARHADLGGSLVTLVILESEEGRQ